MGGGGQARGGGYIAGGGHFRTGAYGGGHAYPRHNYYGGGHYYGYPRFSIGVGLGYGYPYYSDRYYSRGYGNCGGGYAGYASPNAVRVAPRIANLPPYGYYYYDPYCDQEFASLDLYLTHVREQQHENVVEVVDEQSGRVAYALEYYRGRWVFQE